MCSPSRRPVVTAELMLPVLRKEPFLVGVIEPDLVPDVADGFARVWPLGAGELANIVRSKARGVWNPSNDDVLESALEGVVGAVDELLRRSCWEWAIINHIRPPLLVGTVIEQGTIDGICEQFAATYRVRRPAVEPSLLQTYQLVAFEDAKPV